MFSDYNFVSNLNRLVLKKVGLRTTVPYKFGWLDGTPVDYRLWEYGQPNDVRNEICVEFSKLSKFYDSQCTAQKYSICEYA